MTGVHCCQRTDAYNLSPRRTTSVAPAAIGAAACDVPSGASDSLRNTTDMTVTASSISTVPATTGVISRRNSASRDMNTNCSSAETKMRLDNIAGPPATSAVVETAMNVVGDPTVSA